MAQMPERTTEEWNHGHQDGHSGDQASSDDEVKRDAVEHVSGRGIEPDPQLTLLLEVLKAQALASA